MKYLRRKLPVLGILAGVLVLLCSTICLAGSIKYREEVYGTCIQIGAKKTAIQKKKKTGIEVKTKGSSKQRAITVLSVRYKNLTPTIAGVYKNGTVKGKKIGTARIRVTVRYKVVEEIYTKCEGGAGLHYWMTDYRKETKTVRIKVKKKLTGFASGSDLPLVGGSVCLNFVCDGVSYGSPISVGVGINPDIDYKDQFPKDPEKEGYRFEGWVTKSGVRIGTKAGEIYEAFELVQSGQSATVYASFVKLS